MAFRFRRTVSIFPGIRVNLGKSGASLSAGMRGANLTLGRDGLFGNVGIPGTGLSYREKLKGMSSTSSDRDQVRFRSPELATLVGQISQIQIDTQTGEITVHDDQGNDLGPAGLDIAKAYGREAIEEALVEQVTQHNRMLQELGAIHLETPGPDDFPACVNEEFQGPMPPKPELRKLDWLAYICPARRRALNASNERKNAQYQRNFLDWRQKEAEHERRNSERKLLYQRAREGDVSAMEAVLDDHFFDIDWPQSTEVSFEISADGKSLMLDVNLPEIEDFPSTELRIYRRGIGVSVKHLSQRALRKLYMAHVHGTGFRLIGEGFACAPTVNNIILSAFTQTTNSATGREEDKYLYSVKVNRQTWNTINFSGLDQVDPVQALSMFCLRRDMTKTGIFRGIEPWEDP